jgi:hypothetical protein
MATSLRSAINRDKGVNAAFWILLILGIGGNALAAWFPNVRHVTTVVIVRIVVGVAWVLVLMFKVGLVGLRMSSRSADAADEADS